MPDLDSRLDPDSPLFDAKYARRVKAALWEAEGFLLGLGVEEGVFLCLRSALCSAMDDDGWAWSVIRVVERPDRFPMVMALFIGGLPADRLRPLVRHAWCDSESGAGEWMEEQRDDMVKMFFDGRTPDEVSHLPDVLTLYRGAYADDVGAVAGGISWTTDIEVARRFAKRQELFLSSEMPEARAMVAVAQVPRDRVAMWIDDRSERECVVFEAPGCALLEVLT